MYQRSIDSSRKHRLVVGLTSLAFIAAACGSTKTASAPTTAAGAVTTAGPATTAGPTTAATPAPTTAAPVVTTAQVQVTTAAVTTSAAPPAEKPVVGGTLRVALESGITTLDPAQALAQPADKDVALTVYDPLVAFDKDNKFVPYLAESVTASDDLKVWTVVLRKGIKFHDGTDLNADAVVAHWKRMADPATKSPWLTSATDEVPSKKDDSTVLFTMPKANVGFVNDLTTAMGFIPSPTAVAKDPVAYGLTPVGTGPFKVTKFEAGGEIIVEKNATYWKKDDQGGQLPYLDKISFKGIADSQKRLQALQNGEFDLLQTADTTTVVAAEKAKLKVQRVTGSSSTTLIFNNKKAPTDDLKVRQALAAAIDRDTINQVIYEGVRTPSFSIFAINSPFLNKDVAYPKFDLKKAQALVKEYGKPIEILAECIPTPEANSFMELLKQQWEAAGIKVTLKSQDQGAYVARIFGKVGDFQVACFRTNQFAEPDQTRSSYTTEDKNNLPFYSNPDVDKAYVEGNSTTDFAKRKAAYDKVQVGLAATLPGVTLMYDLFGNISSDKVFGLPTPEGSALGAIKMTTVYLKK
jgi:peptide/nickel transport system substrate-binding protein